MTVIRLRSPQQSRADAAAETASKAAPKVTVEETVADSEAPRTPAPTPRHKRTTSPVTRGPGRGTKRSNQRPQQNTAPAGPARDLPSLTGRNALNKHELLDLLYPERQQRPQKKRKKKDKKGCRYAIPTTDTKRTPMFSHDVICDIHSKSLASPAVQAMMVATRYTVGNRASLPYEAFHVAATLNALRRGHTARLSEIGTVLCSMSARDQTLIGLDTTHGLVTGTNVLDRLSRCLQKICDTLKPGIVTPESIALGLGTPLHDTYRVPSPDYTWAVPDHYLDDAGRCTEPVRLVNDEWFHQAITLWGADLRLLTSNTYAIDGTMVDTPARLHGGSRFDYDGDTDYLPEDVAEDGGGKARVLGIGEDGRNVYTYDVDARGGYRTSTTGGHGEEMVGYEQHLACQVRPGTWRGNPEEAFLGPDVPKLITIAVLVPAGVGRTKATLPTILAFHRNVQAVHEIIGDPAYGQGTLEGWHLPLRREGIGFLYQPSSYQRGINRDVTKPSQYRKSEDTLFWAGTPTDIMGSPRRQECSFPMPSIRSSATEHAKLQEPYNRRADWRWRLNKIGSNGTHYFLCPFCAGSLRATNLTVRNGRKPLPSAPFVGVIEGTCCDGPLALTAEQLGRWQEIPAGTTAHAHLYAGRRQAIESVNSRLKGGHVDMGDKYIRVFGIVKRRILTAYSLAAYNIIASENWIERHPEALTSAPGPMKSTRRTPEDEETSDIGELVPAVSESRQTENTPQKTSPRKAATPRASRTSGPAQSDPLPADRRTRQMNTA